MKFRCPNCSQKITAREDRAGTTGRCPRCKGKITVPGATESESQTAGAQDTLTLIDPPPLRVAETMAPSERARLEAEYESAAGRNEDELLTSLGITPQQRYTGERQHLWPLDILLYPTSVSGLTTLGIIVFLTCLLPIVGLFPLMGLILLFFMGLYFGRYLAECVYDSAQGGTRAPEVLTAGLGDMWSRVSYLVATHVLFVVPLVIYTLFAREADLVFYGLLIWTILFFPMGLLAMAIMDSTTALNPLVLLDAIFRTFFSYGGLLVLLVMVTFLMGWLWNALTGFGPALLSALIGGTGFYYTMMVQAHVLGRFYWRNSEKLDWGI